MNPHLILLQKGKHSLLIRYPDRLHLIEVNRKLTEEAEEKLLNGVFSDSALDELGLTRETIHLRDLRGVAVGGPEIGETAELNISREEYERMGPGDLVEIYAGPGALGIEYAYYIQWFSRGA